MNDEKKVFSFMSINIIKTVNYWSSVPLIGYWIMSWIMTFVSPYTGSIPLRIISVNETECKTFLYSSWYIKNPFKSIHAAALTNLGEATMGIAILAWCQNNGYKSIPSRLEVDFLMKARGNLDAICKIDPSKIAKDGGKVTLNTDIFNQKGELVCKVAGIWNVVPLKPKLE
jgi:acyl-coenzyme A thioesterase PaaI-like protein